MLAVDHCTDDDDDDVFVYIITNHSNVWIYPWIVWKVFVHWFAHHGAEALAAFPALIHVNSAFLHTTTHQLFPVCRPVVFILHLKHLAGTLSQTELAWMEQQTEL